MSDTPKVRYLKEDRGRFYYQRRVPQKLQAVVGMRKWLCPCGDVDYAKAVQLIVTWAEEHDAMIADLRDPDKRTRAQNATRGRSRARTREAMSELGLPRFVEMIEQRPGEKQYFPVQAVPRPWQAAAKLLEHAEASRRGDIDVETVIRLIDQRVQWVSDGEPPNRVMRIPDHQQLVDYIDTHVPADARKAIKVEIGEPPRPMSDLDYLDALQEAYEVGYGEGIEPPNDADDRDQYDFIKRKLERKISELSPDPNTISRVADRYYDFNSIRSLTRSKYKRNIDMLVQRVGDVPLAHVNANDLRKLRDDLTRSMKPASVHAIFTPIKGLFGFAIHEEILDVNPMAAVKLPRDKRPIEERKWTKFEPVEVERILSSVDDYWGKPMRGLSDERRDGIRMVVRILAFSGMRPIEVLRLTAEDIEEHLIRIRGSKTESSTRVLPLHSELADVPAWIRSGGLQTFSSINTDPVSSVRHNFERLIRELMPEPILDPKKVLYSFRTTFVNAMRRAGADIQVQRAILGHKEAGAIRHYDDGPEFEIKNKCVQATDPRRLHPASSGNEVDDEE